MHEALLGFDHCPKKLKETFDKFDTGKKRFLDKDKTKRLFMNMFPTFSKYCFLYMLLCACFFL